MADASGGRAGVIRRGTAADLAAIRGIEAGGAGANWRPEEYLAYEVWVAETEAGEVAGFAVARSVAAGEWELLNLAVAPASRRQGVGAALLRRLLDEHAGVGYLEVRRSNLAAQKLYEKLGFEAVGRRAGYYQDQNSGSPEEGIVFRFQS